ncbi:hypothetical protein BC831DRAFT_449434 [Entophlyctis helioformis]|nr:hypothetical protein BC831DRAFT_449434 [Entophlyctis helioformis]
MGSRQLDEWAAQLCMMCDGVAMEDALLDLAKTGSLEASLNRFFDGTFLEGTERDPSLQLLLLDDTFDAGHAQPRSPVEHAPPPATQPRPEPPTKAAAFAPVASTAASLGNDIDSDDDCVMLDDAPPASTWRQPASQHHQPSQQSQQSEQSRQSQPSQGAASHYSSDLGFSDLHSMGSSSQATASLAATRLASDLRLSSSLSSLGHSDDDLPAATSRANNPSLNDMDGMDSDSDLDPSQSARHVLQKRPATDAARRARPEPQSDDTPKASKYRSAAGGRKSLAIDLLSSNSSSSESDGDKDSEVAPLSQASSASSSLALLPQGAGASKRKRDASSSGPSGATSRALLKAAEAEERKKQREEIKAAKAAEKERAKAAKAAEKEQQLEERRMAKEQAAIEKQLQQSTRSVNRIRQKYECTKEMVAIVSPEWASDPIGSAVLKAITDAGAETRVQNMQSLANASSGNSSSITLTNLMAWERQSTRQWCKETNQWEPCPTKVEREAFVLIRLTAPQFAQLCVGANLIQHFEAHLTAFPGHKLIYFIEDLDAFYRSRQRNEQAHYTKQMRTALVEALRTNASSGGGSNSNSGADTATGAELAYQRQKQQQMALQALQQQQQRVAPAPTDGLPPYKTVEENLTRLQFFSRGRCFIHICKVCDTPDWIVKFTEQIACAPDLRARADTVQVRFGDTIKSGRDAPDTWLRMLEQVPTVSTAKAGAIRDRYKTFGQLVRAYAACRTAAAAVHMLVGLPIPGTGKSIGPEVSRRVYDAFWGTNPNNLMS